MLEEIRNKKPSKALKNRIINVSIDADKLSKLIQDIYMQGYLDRDWKISESQAEEISESFSVRKMLIKCMPKQ